MSEYLNKRTMKANAERICDLADAFGHLPCGDGDKRSIEQLLNLSIPCARLIQAGVVTQVVDSFDSVNDQAVEDVEVYCHLAIRRLVLEHGDGWWTEQAAKLGLRFASNVRVLAEVSA